MTDTPVLVIFVVQLVTCWGALLWLARERLKDMDYLNEQIKFGATRDTERHMDSLGALASLTHAQRTHTHSLEPHDHSIYALVDHNHDAGYAPSHHDHPHEHVHVSHTHTLVNRSEHEENGKKVVVKTCQECGTVFRDKQD